MGQYFTIINQAKRQYLDPFSMRSSERFPALLEAEEMTRSICWLVCTSTNPYWRELKRKNERTNRIVGSWAGDLVEIIGDTNEEDLSHHVKNTFHDISYEVVATIFDFDSDYMNVAIQQLTEWPSLLEQLGMLMMLSVPPNGLDAKLKTVFPNGWERDFDQYCKSQHRDPRDKLKRLE